MNDTTTPLCDIAYKYGTDKCPQLKHAYTPFYYQLLKDRQKTIQKVLELGIGHYRGMDKNEWTFDPGLNRRYHRGASLYMWRDFFPNAQIFAADRVKEAMISDDRIQSYLIDERKAEDLKQLIEATGADVELVIDDASHRVDDQIFAAKTLLPLLNDNVIYIIEDVSHSRAIRKALAEIGDFEYNIPDIPRKWHGGMLVVITKKKHDTK